MVGGTTSGYSLMGKRPIASKPTIKTIVESTPAKIGRWIKKLEKFIESLVENSGDVDFYMGPWRQGLLIITALFNGARNFVYWHQRLGLDQNWSDLNQQPLPGGLRAPPGECAEGR